MEAAVRTTLLSQWFYNAQIYHVETYINGTHGCTLVHVYLNRSMNTSIICAFKRLAMREVFTMEEEVPGHLDCQLVGTELTYTPSNLLYFN